jgi:hypothetical protein
MKLKIKHISNEKEPYRVEVPNGCSLAELKQALVEQLTVLPSASASDVVVSLNRKASTYLHQVRRSLSSASPLLKHQLLLPACCDLPSRVHHTSRMDMRASGRTFIRVWTILLCPEFRLLTSACSATDMPCTAVG